MSEGKLVVVGQGYVGLPISMRAVEVGFEVVGFDVDHDRVSQLAGGFSYVEDISGAALSRALSAGRFVPTTDVGELRDFDFAIITVPTPLRESLPDLSFIEVAARTVGEHVTAGSTVVLESTTYPGTTEELFVPLLEDASGLKAGVDFFVGYSPERIDPGNKTFTLVNTPKVVSGIDDASTDKVRTLYDKLVTTTVPVATTREAELTKLLENTFRHVNIALVNELAMYARDLGIDVWEAIDAASTKPFGFMPFTPGPGVGGHCLPVDPSYLSWQVRRTLGHSFRFVELANDVNDHMPDYVVRRLTAMLNQRERSVKGSRIVLLGLAYKRNTGDVRESPAVRVAELLAEFGADVWACDPHVEDARLPHFVRHAAFDEDTLEGADAIVLLTDHDDFDVELIGRSARPVLDTRRKVRGPNVEYI